MKNIKILILDDDPLNYQDIQHKLESLNYNVIKISDENQDLINSIISLKPDIILLSTNLSEENNIISIAEEIVNRINTPIIFLYDDIDNEEIIKIKQLNNFSYILEPVDENKLNLIIKSTLYTKQLEQKLSLYQNQYDNIEKISKTGFLKIDLIKNNIILSNGSYNIFNIDPKDKILNIEIIFDKLHSDDKKSFKDKLDKSLFDGTPFSLTIRTKNSNDKYKYIKSKGDVIYNKKKKPIGYILHFTDVTEIEEETDEKNRILKKTNTRVQELDTFNKMNILYNIKKTVDEILKDSIGLLILSFHDYPDISIQITFEKNIYKSKNLNKTKWKISRDIEIFKQKKGIIDVYYSEKKMEKEKKLFLNKSSEILEIFTTTLSRIIEFKLTELININILKFAADSFIIINIDGNFLKINKSFIKLSGYTYEELINKNIFDLEGLHSRIELKKRINLTKETGKEIFESKLKNKNGILIDIEISMNFVPIGRGWFFTFIKNITEKKEQKKKNKEIKEKFNLIFNNIDEGIMFVNIQTKKVEYVNPVICTMLEYEKEELENISINQLYSEKSRKLINNTFSETLLKENVTLSNIECIKKDKRILYADISSSFIELNNNKYRIQFYKNILKRKKLKDDSNWNSMIHNTDLEIIKFILKPNSNIKNISEFILNKIFFLTNSKDGYISVIENKTSKNKILFCSNEIEHILKNNILIKSNENNLYQGIFGYTLNKKKGFFSNDPESHESFIEILDFKLKNIISIPILYENKPAGQICLMNKETNFLEKDFDIALEISDYYHLALKIFDLLPKNNSE